MARTAWFYGGFVMFVLVTPVVWLAFIHSPLIQSPLVLVHSAFFLLYAVFIAVAIWRSANNYRGWFAWRALAKGAVLVVFLGFLGFLGFLVFLNTFVQLAVS